MSVPAPDGLTLEEQQSELFPQMTSGAHKGSLSLSVEEVSACVLETCSSGGPDTYPYSFLLSSSSSVQADELIYCPFPILTSL